MKIAFFTDCFLDLTGGIVTSISAQKKELERLGHTVYIFTTGYSRTKKEINKLAKDNIFVVPTCRVFFRGIAPISRRPRIIEKWIIENFPEIKKFDVFHIHYEGGCSIAGIRLGHEFGVPVVQTMHGREDMGVQNIFPLGMKTFIGFNLNWFHSWYLPHEVKIKKDSYLALTKARAKMWTMMVNHANMSDIVLTPSEHFRQKLIHYGVTKPFYVLGNGVPDEEVSKKYNVKKFKSGETLKIIWFSRLSGEKRFMDFIKALSLVENNYHLDVYGKGETEMKAKSFAKVHKMNVKFHGTVKSEKIFEKLNESHLSILASYDFDNQPMTMLESEAFGVPVLICDPDMQTIVPKDGVILSKDKSSEAMAESLNYIFKHPEIIEKMSRVMIENRDEVKQSTKVQELLGFYNKAIRNKK